MPAALALLALSCRTTSGGGQDTYVSTLEQENAALRIENMRLRADIEELQARLRPDPLAMVPVEYQQAKPLVFFSTASSSVPAKYMSGIREIADILIEHPDLYITLEGYSDQRGASDFNTQLAEDRALAVASLIESSGVESYRINIQAVGARLAPEGELSGTRLQDERKVIAVIHSSAH